MKKAIIILSALLTLVACNTEIIEIETETETTIDASKVVFKINVNKSVEVATKGVKTDWESGDVVYLFFEAEGNLSTVNNAQYVKMTYDGDSWAYSDKDGGDTYSGLTLYASGKHVSAVYMPGFVVGSATPSYTGGQTGRWSFGSGIGGFVLTAEAADYTVTVGDVFTLEATINMTAPANLVQVCIPAGDAGQPGNDNEFVLNMTNVKPFTFDGIARGGAARITTGTVNFPLTAYYGTMGNDTATGYYDTGYYFWGILDNASLGSTSYNFQLVEQKIKVVTESGYETVYKYAISSKSKTVANKSLTGSTAIKLSNLTDNGKFVSLGYSGGPLWATGNLKDDGQNLYDHIADPLEAGNYYKWCYTTPYQSTLIPIYDEYNDLILYYEEEYYSGGYTNDKDPAYVKSNSAWCMPTQAQFEALLSSTNTTKKWKKKWTNIGGDNGGELITSNLNGISLFFAAAGFVESDHGSGGHYWSSTPFDSSSAWPLDFDSYGIFVTDNSKHRYRGMSIRPVTN